MSIMDIGANEKTIIGGQSDANEATDKLVM
jgi:hypothetical protein